MRSLAVLSGALTVMLLGGCGPSGHQVLDGGSYNLLVNNSTDHNVSVVVDDRSDPAPFEGANLGPIYLGAAPAHGTGYFYVSVGRHTILLDGKEDGAEYNFDHSGTPVVIDD
jgi:hypothetical protein